jgi:nucleotide-binding universal stress UspA family protein
VTETFRHVLVPIDLSERNGRVLAVALALARQGRARVTLLHVVQRVPHASLAELRAFYRRLRDKSRARLDAAARRFVAAGVPVRQMVLIGEPARQIVGVALRRRADLVVMRSHRVGPGTRGWGTTSYKVGIGCPSSVLLVK